MCLITAISGLIMITLSVENYAIPTTKLPLLVYWIFLYLYIEISLIIAALNKGFGNEIRTEVFLLKVQFKMYYN